MCLANVLQHQCVPKITESCKNASNMYNHIRRHIRDVIERCVHKHTYHLSCVHEHVWPDHVGIYIHIIPTPLNSLSTSFFYSDYLHTCINDKVLS